MLLPARLWIEMLIRLFAAVLVGGLIGSERARHGRAAGMRTHILVCLGAVMTSLVSLYVAQVLNVPGDVFRIPAQVISGIGFLGAGMIVLKSSNVITGLTTAAGVWTTAVIGVALGYGFYAGVIVMTLLFVITINLFAKFESKKKATKVLYIEIDDLYQTNAVLNALETLFGPNASLQTVPPKSGCAGHLGISVVADNRSPDDFDAILQIGHTVFVAADQI